MINIEFDESQKDRIAECLKLYSTLNLKYASSCDNLEEMTQPEKETKL